MIRVVVTQEDIRDGIRQDCKLCPVARAIRRACPGREVQVNGTNATIDGQTVALPEHVECFISQFDHPFPEADLICPFGFTLDFDPETTP